MDSRPPFPLGPAESDLTPEQLEALQAYKEWEMDGKDLPDFFPIPPTRQVDHIEPPLYQRPLLLLTFSYTPERKLVWGNAAMKFYKDPPLNASLNRDYDKWIKRPEERGRLDGLLRALRRKACKPEAARADIVTWRGIMTKIITAPYETREGWELNAMFINDCLYIEEHSNDAKLQAKEDMTPQHRLASYYGYAFESYCTSDRAVPPNAPPQGDGWGGPVDTNVQWCSVVKTKLDNLRIIMGAEVDCVRETFTGQTDTFVELKTSKVIRNARDDGIFRSKTLKYWAQSYLLGIPEVVVGFRTEDGKIASTHSFNTMDFPKMAKERGGWSGKLCLDFGREFLNYLLRRIRFLARGPKGEIPQVFRITFKPGVGIDLRFVKYGADRAEVENGEDRMGILPMGYYELVKPPISPLSFDMSEEEGSEEEEEEE